MLEVEIKFPLWALGASQNRTRGLARGVDANGTKGIILFNDGSLAQAFKNSDSRLANYWLRIIANELAFLGFLVLLEKEGFENVVFNPNPAPTSERTGAIKVAELRADITRMFD